MIRRNTAGQTIYLPPLLLVADGSAVTSGASLQVAKDGTEASSAGTLVHVSGGVWKYTPTQAETDAGIVGLILTATDAVPVVVNLVTTAADTSAVRFGAAAAGDEMGLSDGAIAAAKVAAGALNGKGDWLTTLGANAPAGWINAAAIAAAAITDAKIASNAFTAAKFAASSLNGKGNWNVGKTGYSLTQAFPANFPALGINASGHVSRVVLVDTTTTNTDMVGTNGAYTGTPPTASTIASAVMAAGDADGYTLEETLKICMAALAGKLSGAGTTTVTIRAADDSKARITATVTEDGNRTAVTLDGAG